jgi:hypothetical protein
MADEPISKREARLREDIRDIARRQKQVRFAEIERIVSRLGEFTVVGTRPVTHGTLFTVGTERFSVVSHNPGDSHVKRIYVKKFLESMLRLGWWEEER